MYIEGVGTFDSQNDLELFEILPEILGEVTYDPKGPRYIINMGKYRGPRRYLQFNVESKKVRIILVDDKSRSFDLFNSEVQEREIEIVAQDQCFESASRELFDENAIVALYQAQQQLRRCLNEIMILGKKTCINMHDFIFKEVNKTEVPKQSPG